MRIVLQRVSRASVSIAGRVAGSIGRGFVLLAGFHASDTAEQVDWLAAKVAGLRLFADDEGKMNLGLAEVEGAVLVVSQFTLYGDTERGTPPLVRRRRAAGAGRSAVRALPGPAPGRGPPGGIG